MENLYVDFDGLEENIGELKRWKEEFNILNDRINVKLEELNSVWQGKDYDTMKNTITQELKKITGSDGMIQTFVNNSINDLERKRGNYAAIQDSNANYWG